MKVTELSIFLTPFGQHELLQPGEHGEDPAGVGQPVVGQGLHQAGVHHTEGVGIGVFHYMAGMAAAMPGLIKFPSAGKKIEANR